MNNKNTEREETIRKILEGIRCIKRHMHSSKKKTLRVTPAQWALLHQILHEDTNTIKELAEHFNMSKSAVTQQVNSLVDEGYLQRTEDQNDRRSIVLSATPSFKKKAQDMKKKMMAKFAELFEPLSDAELKTFAKLHKKISQHLTHHIHE